MADVISKRSLVYEILMDFKAGKKSASEAERQIAKAQAATDSWGKSLKNTADTLRNAFITREVIRFTKEMVRLGDEVLDVRGRFNQINKSGALLGNLRKDTKGLIDDLSLMKSAIKAENFRVPLGELGKLLEFARKRANDTGQSVERMTELILEGVGKKSVKSLQEFGLSAAEVNEELKRTPDFARAIGNIAEREFARAGNAASDYGDEIDRLEVEIKNLTQQMSIHFTEFFGTFAKGINEASDESTTFIERLTGTGTALTQLLKVASPLGLAYAKLFGDDVQGNLDKYNQKTKDQRAEIEKLQKDARAAGQALFSSLSPQQLDATDLSFNDIADTIKRIREEAMTLPFGSTIAEEMFRQADELEKQLERALGKLQELKRENFGGITPLGTKSQGELTLGEKPIVAQPLDIDGRNPFEDALTLENELIKANISLKQEQIEASQSLFDIGAQLVGQQSELGVAFLVLQKGLAIANVIIKLQETLAGLQVGAAPFLTNPITAAAAGALLATQTVRAQVMAGINIATIAATAIPALTGFAEGTEWLERGKNRKGVDTIPILADEGERIIPRKENEENWDVYEAIRKGNFDDFIQKEYINPALVNRQFEKGIQVSRAEKDYSQAFYRQYLSTEGTNWNTKGALKYLKSIDRKLTQSSSRYARP